MTTSPGHLRPRSFFEILDGSIRHYRARFVPFLIVFLPVAGAEFFLGVYMAVFQGTSLTGESVSGAAAFFGFSTVFLLGGALHAILSLLGYGSSIYLAAAGLEGRALSPRLAWRRTIDRFWVLVGLGILLTAIVGMGLLLFVIPAIYLAVRFGVSAQVLLLESTNVGDALGRSGELLRGHYWRGFGIAVFIGILVSSLGLLPAAFSFGIMFFIDEEGEIGNPIGYYLSLAFAQTMSALTSLLTAPLTSLVATHFYYDLRVRKEGIDLEARLRQLEAAPA